MDYFGGCEGGGSVSSCVIVDAAGNVVGEAVGEGTNQWLVGLDECCKRIKDMVQSAKASAGLKPELPLKCLGLSLSGADSAENQRDITEKLMSRYPETAQQCYTCNDSLAPLVTATDGGGVVLISGTGSNCLLVNPSGETYNCGGWGHMLGDQGSAYWIAKQTLQIVYQDTDGFTRSPYSTEYLKNAMFSYFNMTDMFGILPHLYPADNKNIDKKKIATFCLEGVVKGAQEDDKLSLHVLSSAGQELGRHVKALIPRMDSQLINQPGGLKIICAGSVWKSWDFLREGFLAGITPQTDEEKELKEISLLLLKKQAKASLGTAAWAARKANLSLPIDYSKAADTFFNYKF